jgi:hypothetical protein
VLNKLFGDPSINFGDENIYFGATTILFGGALNGCHLKVTTASQCSFKISPVVSKAMLSCTSLDLIST